MAILINKPPTENPTTDNQFVSAKDYDNGWYAKWVKSPEYSKRLVSSGVAKDKNQAKYFVDQTLASLGKVGILSPQSLNGRDYAEAYKSYNDMFENKIPSINDFEKIVNSLTDSKLRGRSVGFKNEDDEAISRSIILRDINDVGTGAHEITHSIFLDPFIDELINTKFPYKDRAASDDYQYMKSDGIYPEIMNVRRVLGLTPGQNVTADMLLDKKVEPQLFRMLSTHSMPDILKMFNTLASNSIDNRTSKQQYNPTYNV